MDDNTKKMILGQFEVIRNSLKIGNSFVASRQSTDIIVMALANKSKIGVMIGEIVESSIVQYHRLIQEFNLEPNSIESETTELFNYLADLESKIDGGDEREIYQSLSELRMHVTYNQIIGFSAKYKMNPRRRSF